MDFTIGISGLRVAQQAIDLIGTNISNAATEGYHRQDLRLAPVDYGTASSSRAGVRVVDVRRYVDELLEAELVHQQPLHGKVDRELTTLETIESLFGEIDAEGLGTAINRFFNTLRELSAQPNSQPLQEQAVWAADALATQFRTLAEFLQDLKEQVVVEAQSVTAQVNSLAAEIANLNGEVCTLTLRQGNVNTLLDRRDQAISDLARLIELETADSPTWDGVVNVTSMGMPLAVSDQVTEIEVGIVADDKLGVSAKDAHLYTTVCNGGQLGGLLALRNDLIPDVISQLDALATEIADQVNALHVQGVGTAGAFTELTGWASSAESFADWNADVDAGSFFVRVTNTDTGKIIRHEVSVELTDTLADVAAVLDGLQDADGTAALSAAIVDSRLRLAVTDAAKFTFDFLPAPLAEAEAPTWTGTASPTASGIYTGAANDVYTLTAVGAGQVGTGTLSVEVRNEAGELVTTANVGAGYAPADRIDIGNGLYVALAAGSVNDGEAFTIRALANSDETHLLAAAGLNTFFEGDSALTFRVESGLLESPGRVAASLGEDMTDNVNVRRIAELSETAMANLGGITPADAYRHLVTGVGREAMLRQARLEGLESVIKQLSDRRDEIGGVDINEQAAGLLIYERMFQAVAKFMSTQDETLKLLGDLL
jgi:flagellar hook-associated protein 1 FlgK